MYRADAPTLVSGMRVCAAPRRARKTASCLAILLVVLPFLTVRQRVRPYTYKEHGSEFHLLSNSSRARKEFDLQREVEKVVRAKLERYELFERRTQGSGQPAGAWYQDNAEPVYTCIHAERIGPHGEGGKWMCNPQKFRDGAPCLIYSIGSQDDFRWEKAILETVSSSCEIHVFDHTVLEPKKKPDGVHYHTWGLGSLKTTTSHLKTLQSMVRELHHEDRVIDVLKIDCEGCEWETFQEWFDAQATVDELLVELHTGTQQPANNPPAKAFMSFMLSHDMLIYHKEPNVKYSGFDGLCVEFAFFRFERNSSKNPLFREKLGRIDTTNTSKKGQTQAAVYA